MYRNIIIFFAAFGLYVSTVQAQYYFNKLDTNLFLNYSVIQNDDTSFVFSGILWSNGGSMAVGLSYYTKEGIYTNIDTLNEYPVLSASGVLLKRPNDFLVCNIINYVPPFDPVNRDIELTCYSYTGDELWTQEYGGSNLDAPIAVITAFDGGLLIAGVTKSFGDVNGDFYLIKTDSDGNFEWQKTYGGPTQNTAYSLEPTLDGNYIISGQTLISSPNWDIYIVKIDPDGNIIWEKTYGSLLMDYGGRIKPLYDNSYIVYRNYDDGSNTVGYIEKLDGNGDVIWSKPFPHNGLSSFGYGQPIENSDGTIISTCSAFNNQGIQINWLLKLDPMGDTIWTKEYFTRPDLPQLVYDIKQTNDNGYMMCGFAFPVDTNLQRAWIIKTDCNGAEDVMYPTGAPCDFYDCTLYPIDAAFTPSAILVDLAVDPTITFTNASLNTTSRVWNFGDGVIDYEDTIISHTYTQTGTFDVSLIVFHGMCSDTITQTVEVINSTGIENYFLNAVDFRIFPNPTNGNLTISTSNTDALFYRVEDIYGREIISKNKFSKKVELDLSEHSNGIYLVIIENESGERIVKRVVKN